MCGCEDVKTNPKLEEENKNIRREEKQALEHLCVFMLMLEPWHPILAVDILHILYYFSIAQLFVHSVAWFHLRMLISRTINLYVVNVMK